MNQLFAFPHNYVMIDIEMTGLDKEKDSIIELAGLRVEEDAITATFSSLIKPEEYVLREDITRLTGITEEMLSSAPRFSERKKEISSFIGNLPIVGHNVPLDIQFLNKAMEENGYPAFHNDYVDTLPLSQKLFPEFIHHRLTDMALYYDIRTDGAHRALQDCYITKSCFDHMRETMKRSFPSEQAFIESFSTTGKRLKAEQVQSFRHSDAPDAPSHIRGRHFVFTGILKQMSRREAMLSVAGLGGINEDKLTVRTDYLVVGRKEEEIVKSGNLSGKEEKAHRLKAEGCPIQILLEDEFYSLLKKQ